MDPGRSRGGHRPGKANLALSAESGTAWQFSIGSKAALGLAGDGAGRLYFWRSYLPALRDWTFHAVD